MDVDENNIKVETMETTTTTTTESTTIESTTPTEAVSTKESTTTTNTNTTDTITEPTTAITATTATNTTATTTKAEIDKPKYTIPENNAEITKFTTVTKLEKGSIEYRNLVYRLEAFESRYFKKEIIPSVAQLHSINVCPRCILRFLNIKELSIYQEPYEILVHLIKYVLFKQRQNDIKEKQTTTTTTTTPVSETTVPTTAPIEEEKYDPNSLEANDFVCCCCLGALQDTNNKDLFSMEFIIKMKSSGYQFSTYSLAISLPMACTIREQSIWYYLQDSFPGNWEGEEPKIVDIKEGVKWILGPLISRQLLYNFKPSSDFRSNLVYIHDETQDDHKFLLEIQEGRKNNKRPKHSTKRIKVASQDSHGTVMEMLNNTSKKDFLSYGVCPPRSPVTKYQYQLTFKHEPIYIAGKYKKFVRDLSQTPWEHNDSSVQDIVCKDIKSIFLADQVVFTTSGREDIDVRMLGNGRPFYIEIVNPHTIYFAKQDFQRLETAINTSTKKIEVSNLQMITKKETTIIKDSGGTKQKNYRCVIWTSRTLQPSDLDALNNMSNIEIQQNTPVRVLHRRSLMVRSKKISKLVATFISPHFFTLDIIDAQAGTYIKEFVHGDLGRTLPNIGQLLGNCEADILQLDVLNVDLNFPPERK